MPKIKSEKPKPPKEKEIVKMMMQMLRYYGIYCQKIPSGGGLKDAVNKRGEKIRYAIKYADTGTPDIFSCVPVTITPEMVGQTYGFFVAIEAKRSEAAVRRWQKQVDKHSQEQMQQMEKIAASDGFNIISHSPTEVIQILQENNFLKIKQ